MKIKALISLLLIASMLLVSCTGGDTTESNSSEVSDISTDESSQEPVTGDPSVKAEIDKLYVGVPDRTLTKTNVAKGKTYVASTTAHTDYADNGKKLTDGVEVDSFDKSVWVGYYNVKALAITLDLGGVVEDIADISISSLFLNSYGIYLSKQVTIESSTDGENFTQLGVVYSPTGLDGSYSFDYSLILQGTVKASHIRFTFSETPVVWLFLDEIIVNTYTKDGAGNVSVGDGKTSNEYYGDSTVAEITEPTYWDKSESDYSKTINLVSYVKPKVKAYSAILSELTTEYYNSITALTKLTDGNYSNSTSYANGNWVHFTAGNARELVFDLGNTSTVTGFKGGFLFDSQSGIKLPRNLSLILSQNGVDWQTVHIIESVTTDKASSIERIDVTLDKQYKARYAKLFFNTDSHVWCDEIEIIGTKKIQSGALDVQPDADNNTIFPNRYITKEEFCDVSNMLLSYHCLQEGKNHSETGLITLEEYLPHVGYYDKDGKLTDTFFDSFLYLPYTAFNYSDYGRSFDGWKFYIDNQFTKERNVEALNTATAQVASELGLSDYKSKVFMSILYTFRFLKDDVTKNTFGDIDGDGVNENFDNIADRKKAIKWLVDEQVKRFKDGNFTNLELCGFYWFEEAIAYSDPHEIELIAYARDYVHSLGYKIFWIPYYNASGYAEWKKLGFDLACMQPNYAFSATASEKRLYENAATTKLLGMCVEIEHGGDIARYKSYLAVGAETGYMNSVKIYYQGGVPGEIYTAYKSKDPLTRSVYDDTYLFAKEKYVQVVDTTAPAPLSLTTTVSTSVNGKVTVESANSDYTIRLALSPKYGSVHLNTDGSFTYTPADKFEGEDYFEVCADYLGTISESSKVSITVG